ncbi:MAG TPA: helix-hairpin-helix domain-containing protein, partial [Bacillota bacterium]|nr:helix-hairpin-helix domain-containing protein [Bacillota bacterium]
IVNEAGASVYSASPLAQKEFPGLDVAERSAVSIARRLQDPLAELVKIDPRSIGVGQYQHDMPPRQLSEALAGTVEACVNSVGVDLNTASAPLLSYVAGINKTVAERIVAFRDSNGGITSREQLLEVSGLGPKVFKQCAGFLRLPDSPDYLERSAVHPESYALARRLMERLEISPESLGRPEAIPSLTQAEIEKLAAELDAGVPTVSDILEEFRKPGRDPREGLPKPVFLKSVTSMEDLQPGMTMMGIVRNIVDFGAFVDIGVHQDGLVHISEIADRYIKHPLEVLQIEEVVPVKILSVDRERNRIALSIKQADASA